MPKIAVLMAKEIAEKTGLSLDYTKKIICRSEFAKFETTKTIKQRNHLCRKRVKRQYIAYKFNKRFLKELLSAMDIMPENKHKRRNYANLQAYVLRNMRVM